MLSFKNKHLLQALAILQDKNEQMVGEEFGFKKKQRKKVGRQSLLYILRKDMRKFSPFIIEVVCMLKILIIQIYLEYSFGALLICLIAYLHTWNLDLQVFLNLN